MKRCHTRAPPPPSRGLSRRFLLGLYIPYVHSRPEPLRAQRSGEQASGTRRLASIYSIRSFSSPEPDALHRDTCSGVAGNQVFGERLPRLLTGEIVFFHSGGSSSWWTFARIEIDYFVFFLVDVRGTALRTSSCTDCGPLLRATHYVD